MTVNAQTMLELADELTGLAKLLSRHIGSAAGPDICRRAAAALAASPAIAGVAAPVAWMVEGLHSEAECYFNHQKAVEAFSDWGKKITPLFAALPPSQEVPAPAQAKEMLELAEWARAVPKGLLSHGSPHAEYFERIAKILERLTAVPQCAREARQIADCIRDYLQNKYGTAAVQISSDGIERIYYNGIPLKELAAALSGKPGAAQDQLSQLRQAILDHTQGDGFWIGEILLTVLAKETGFNGSVPRPDSGGGA